MLRESVHALLVTLACGPVVAQDDPREFGTSPAEKQEMTLVIRGSVARWERRARARVVLEVFEGRLRIVPPGERSRAFESLFESPGGQLHIVPRGERPMESSFGPRDKEDVARALESAKTALARVEQAADARAAQDELAAVEKALVALRSALSKKEPPAGESATTTRQSGRADSSISAQESVLLLPDASSVPLLNECRGTLDIRDGWGPLPWSPIVAKEIDESGSEWYVHEDDTRTRTRMVFREDLGRWEPRLQVVRRAAAGPPKAASVKK